MPQEYIHRGLRFMYPDGWELDHSEMLAGKSSVAVYSPGGAFWSVSVHPRDADPHRLAESVLKTMELEYDTVDSESQTVSLGGRKLVGYEMNFFFLDLVCTATIRCVQTEQATYAFFCQGEDREFQAQAKVFDAITTSFLSHVKKLSYWDD
ncbi:hypothetical protein JCM19992_05680 [Thermostilla marina]